MLMTTLLTKYQSIKVDVDTIIVTLNFKLVKCTPQITFFFIRYRSVSGDKKEIKYRKERLSRI